MRRLIAALALLCTSTPALAETSRRHLALGGFEERGRGVRGHGRVLKSALAFELSHTGAFQLVADDEAKRAAISKIKDTNRHSVDERHWVQVGQAVGATHLLLGEVRQDRNTCTAFAQLVHLESRATKVTRPEYYDCTNYDLVELAGDLAAQLSGQRASPANARRHRRPPQRPVEIVMEGRAAKVDGEDYTFYELDRAPAEAPAPAPDDEAPAPSPAPAPAEPEPPTPTAPEPPAAEAPPRLPPPPADLDLDRFPALRPVVDGEGRPLLNLYALARHLDRRGALVAGLVLGLPVLFLLVGVLLLRAREAWGEVWLRFGFSLSVLFASAAAATLLLYRYGLHRAVTEDTAAYLVAAPFAALALWLVGGRLMHVLGVLPWFRQLLWAALLTATIFALLLLATQLQAHVAWYGASLLFLWLALRAMVALRKRRKLA